jgi:long-subunit acyl-CoA synthetase (AMP-forming)
MNFYLVMSHKNFDSFCGAVHLNPQVAFTPNDVALSYLPLHHIL